MQTEYGPSAMRDASALYLEFSDYVESVENSVKFVGDFYLATIFRSAVARFNLREWEKSVILVELVSTILRLT